MRPLPWPLWAFAAVAVASCAAEALGQDVTADCSHVAALPGAVTARLGTDTVIIAPHPQADAQLCYANDAGQGSIPGPVTVTLGGLSVDVGLHVGPGAERAIITPPPGFVVWPADYGDVPVRDGQAITVQIFGGGDDVMADPIRTPAEALVEIVAQALWEHGAMSFSPWCEANALERQGYVAEARAVLTALREVGALR